MKGDITIDKMSGLVYRDGKVLGRKNWEVECEIDLRLVKNTIVKAASQEEITKLLGKVRGVNIFKRLNEL